jgi:c-di-GMP-binding flagellar brake protein YcgR
MLESQEVVVVGYLDSVKLQFDAHNLVLVRGERSSVLNCALPRELFRFQRRSAYRVRPVLRSSPMARVRHTEIAEMQLALRVLDVSIGGCALFLPDDVPPMQPGVVLNQVQIELDADTRFHVNLRLQHVTSLNSESHGVRLGCEFVRADATALRALQRFIDQTQKRGRLLSIS